MEIKLEHVLLFLLFVLFLKMIRDKCGCNRVVEGARPGQKRHAKGTSTPSDTDLVPTPPTPPPPAPARPSKPSTSEVAAAAWNAAAQPGAALELPLAVLAMNPATASEAEWYHKNVGAPAGTDASHVSHFFKNL